MYDIKDQSKKKSIINIFNYNYKYIQQYSYLKKKKYGCLYNIERQSNKLILNKNFKLMNMNLIYLKLLFIKKQISLLYYKCFLSDKTFKKYFLFLKLLVLLIFLIKLYNYFFFTFSMLLKKNNSFDINNTKRKKFKNTNILKSNVK